MQSHLRDIPVVYLRSVSNQFVDELLLPVYPSRAGIPLQRKKFAARSNGALLSSQHSYALFAFFISLDDRTSASWN
jgi:hypothetical protein